MSAGKDVYLSAKEIEIIRLALDAEYDHCGEIVGDYKPTERETKDYNEAVDCGS